jgi:hypothetical protein
LVFDYPTIETMTSYLAQEVLALGETAAPPVAESPPAAPNGSPSTSMVESIEDLSDEEVDRLLAERLRAG